MPRYGRCVAVPQRRSVAENCEPVTARSLAIGAIAAQPSKRPNQRPKTRSPLDMAFFLVHPNVGPELASAVRIGSWSSVGQSMSVIGQANWGFRETELGR
jgi:hypothetical protein